VTLPSSAPGRLALFAAALAAAVALGGAVGAAAGPLDVGGGGGGEAHPTSTTVGQGVHP